MALNDIPTTKQRKTILSEIIPYLSLADKVFLTGLAIGLILIYFNIQSKAIIQVSVLGLSITYFLTAFKIIDIPRQEDEVFGFKNLQAYIIAPKVIWISCGISLFGLFIYTLQLGHDGHKRMFMTGGLGIAIGLIIIGYAFITGTKHLKFTVPIVIRAVPLLIIDFYLLYN